MPKTKVPQNVKPEGYWRAIGAFSIDLALTIVAIVLLYVSIGNTLIYKAVDYAGDIAKMDAFMEGTALVNIKAPKSYGYFDFQDKEGEVPAYQKYIDRVWNYFTVLCADPNSGYDINPPMTSFDNEHDFVPFTGEKTVENIGKWVYDHYFTSNLWKAPVKEGTQDPDYSKAPIPAEDPTGREAKLKTAMYDVTTTTPKGTYAGQQVDKTENIFYFAKNVFVSSADYKYSTINVTPFRAYYATSSSNNASLNNFSVVFEEGEGDVISAITSATAVLDVNAPVYDIQGRMIATSYGELKGKKLAAGVYVVNGVKVIVK